MAATSAAARSVGDAVASQILFDFRGPFAQSGPMAQETLEARSAKSVEVAKRCDLMLDYRIRGSTCLKLDEGSCDFESFIYLS
jgi:hypothetical protein